MEHYQPGAQSSLGPHAASGFTSEELRARARCEAARAWQGPRILVVALDDKRLSQPERDLIHAIGDRLCGIEPAEDVA
ncbi:MAG: hypothetical protein K2Q10_13415 [Rhodospirillales bacterium]|nr:hypothetical protein [Rhodospirillales bacterium]